MTAGDFMMARPAHEWPPDRTGWPPGPWDDEPEDRVEWRHAGFPCLLVRGPMGAWCGYVGVPPGHLAHGKDYGDVNVDVHGGLTFARPCHEDGPICHVPAPGEPDEVWWLGFDCNHYTDVAPKMLALEAMVDALMPDRPRILSDDARADARELLGVSYKSRDWVRAETNGLAEQLARGAETGQKADTGGGSDGDVPDADG